MDGTGYNLSDLAAVTGNRDGFGDGNGWWIIIFLIFAFMGFGNNGFNRGGEQVATNGDVQRGFDTAEITRKLDGLANGLSDGFYAQNTTMLNGFSGVTAAVNQARFDSQQCCCETNRNIDSVNYNLSQQACNIMKNDDCNTQKILDAITGNRMADMQNQINQLQLQAAMCGVVRYPTMTTYNAGFSPCFNNGCGC